MKNLKKILNVFVAILAFGFTPSYGNIKSNDSYADLMSSVKGSFESSGMNFQKDFQKDFEGMIKDQMSFNLGVLVGAKNNAPHMSGGGHIPQMLIQQSVGDFSFTVMRLTSNVVVGGVPQNLPYVLFGYNDSNSGYVSTLNGYVPTGVFTGPTLGSNTKVFSYDTQGNGVFTYNDGTHTDKIVITYIGVNNYASFLSSNTTNLFESKYTMMTNISNGSSSLSDEQAGFFQTITYGDLSSLGKKDLNTLNPNSRITTIQFQNNRADLITPTYLIDGKYSLLQNIVPCSTAANPNSVNLDIFISWRGEMGDGRKGEVAGHKKA